MFQKLLFLFVLLLSVKSFAQKDAGPPVVLVAGGKIMGVDEGGIQVFKGIPFAAPPVGELRWKAPRPVKPWSGTRACVAFGPSPMQGKPVPFSMWSAEFLIPEAPIGEDCLYLNVWSGAKKATEKRPVLVWIYGGGFNSGGSGVPIYDGLSMAKQGVVFVSINYRVGLFGFMAHPGLSMEADYKASGNYGLLDQIAALRWVQQNIAAFGGDPRNVTIAGQSAGSMSVNCLVASPLAKGLFNKAIAQSGAFFLGQLTTLQQAEANGVQIGRDLSAASVAELRALPADVILKKSLGMRGPIIDGYVLPASIADIFSAGKQNKVALLTGWNEDEGLMMGAMKKANAFQEEARSKYGTDAAAFLKYYPGANDEEAAQSQLNFSRDQIFGLQNFTWANVQNSQGLPVYVYRFTRKVPATGEYVKYGAFHTGEVPYAYNNLRFVNRPWTDADHQLAQTMAGYWTNFIKTGDPNGRGLPQWPRYEQGGKQVMILDVQPKAAPMADAAALDFMYRVTGSKK